MPPRPDAPTPGGAARPAPVVLLTGFEPFAGAPANPSWDAVEMLAASSDGDVIAHRLPVVVAGLRERLAVLLARHEPDVVVAVGLAAGRPRVSVERVAVNALDGRVPDNAGAQPRGIEVVPGGPPVRRATIDVGECVRVTRAAGHAVEPSDDAGAFVCNATLYHLLDLTEGTSVRAGFVHVPATGADSFASHEALDPGGEVPLVPLAEVVATLRAIVAAATDAGATDGGARVGTTA